MGKLTTHVLDTMHGIPAAGMAVRLYRLGANVGNGGVEQIKSLVLNDDGRPDEGAVLQGDAFTPGRYRLVFGVAAYFQSRGVVLPEPPFLDEVPLEFGIADATLHFHVPLLASPWAYSTYRGS